MYIDIRTRGFPITAALRDHAVRRLRFALSRMGDGILSVSATLGDINGPRGGTDKTCSVRIDLRGRPALVIEHTADDLYAAIDGAAQAEAAILDRVHGDRELRWGGIEEADFAAGGGDHLGDLGAHDAGADDADDGKRAHGAAFVKLGSGGRPSRSRQVTVTRSPMAQVVPSMPVTRRVPTGHSATASSWMSVRVAS